LTVDELREAQQVIRQLGDPL